MTPHYLNARLPPGFTWAGRSSASAPTIPAREYFTNEHAARDYLETIRWPYEIYCPHCGLVGYSSRLWRRESSTSGVREGVYKCSGCRKQFTVTIGTVFKRSHLALHKWLIAIHLACDRPHGVSPALLQKSLKLSPRTARGVIRRLRSVFVQPHATGAPETKPSRGKRRKMLHRRRTPKLCIPLAFDEALEYLLCRTPESQPAGRSDPDRQ